MRILIIFLVCFCFIAKAQPSDPLIDPDSVKVRIFPGDPNGGKDPDTIPLIVFDTMQEVKNDFGVFIILYYKEEIIAVLKKK